MQSKVIGAIVVVLAIVVGGFLLIQKGDKSSVQPPRETFRPVVPGADNAVQQPAGDIKEFSMTAKKWEFSPSTITVNNGDVVKLQIESTDVAHGFALSEFGINERLEPGKIIDVEFVADKSGTFTFSCSVSCGIGHGGMKGQLIVK